jgi:carbon-monoxide dehydrogenase iron sulfur subunit
MKKIEAIEEYCIGCRLCEIHCAVRQSSSKQLIKAFREEGNSLTPRVQVEQSGYVSFALQCRHCDEPACIEACMTGAMHRDPETGAVLCNEDRCVGCWMCVMVCPVGAILRGKGGSVASKCDLCAGEDIPVCVENCPNAALRIIETPEE